MGTGMLNAIDPLGENAALCQGVHRIDNRFYEIGPAGNFRAERMRKVNKNFLSHI
jgi:hypothetical protein